MTERKRYLVIFTPDSTLHWDGETCRVWSANLSEAEASRLRNILREMETGGCDWELKDDEPALGFDEVLSGIRGLARGLRR